MAFTFNPNLSKAFLNLFDSFIAKDQFLLILMGAKSNPLILYLLSNLTTFRK